MKSRPTAEQLFERYVEHHVLHGEHLDPQELCAGREELAATLRRWIAEYRRIDDTLSLGERAGAPVDAPDAPPAQALPEFDGFETIERIGRGGMGDVYKVRDRKLGRTVAAKTLRPDGAAAAGYASFIEEARSLALFEDERIVRIHEFRPDADPPVILMEHVEGFELSRLAPSLEYGQRARVMLEVAEAVQRAHELGIQHRDLKPSNILLDSRLRPKILDFGLSGGDPGRGHLVGTPAYLAPEQFDPSRPIDARTDVYALGVMLYEVLCGERPYAGDTMDALIANVRAARPRLPVEVEPGAPEPLQAIALKAMERDPDDRYPTARELAQDLRRWIEGRPVLARPTLYASALEQRVLPHLEHVEDWLRLKLIYPHEAAGLKRAYRRLRSREDDWIVQSRVLSYSQIALYLGALFLVGGGLLYFGAHRFHDAVEGLVRPLVFLGLPLAGLNLAARLLYRREHRAVAVAYYLGGVLLLPLFLLILFFETGLFAHRGPPDGQFLADQGLSNRQLQLAILLATGLAAWLAARTRTIGLSTAATFLLTLFTLAVLTDFGLEDWLVEERWDLLALHLAPLVAVEGLAAWWLERRDRRWFSHPLFVGAAVLLVLVLELLALDGRALGYLGVSMTGFQAAEVADPELLDTLAAMTLNGIVFYLAAWLMERFGTRCMRPAAWMLAAISPFAILHPVGYLVHTGEYAPGYDWFYLALALTIAVLSHYRQRRSFYLAGLINTSMALFYVTRHNEWFDRPGWAVVVIGFGLALLAIGFGLAQRERARRGG